MTPDSYKVDIIHYLNPHLMWVEVRDPSLQNKFLLEQIGVYGILPLEKTLTLKYVTVEMDDHKCEEWAPFAVAVMKHLLHTSEEVWFSPTYINHWTSIFDNNIHKYGEIIFKMKNGKFKKLSKELIKSGFAYNNVFEFHEKLSCGNLKTKLNINKTQEVIQELENYCLRKDRPKSNWKKSIEEQTSVFRMIKNFESSLTESNLEKNNNEIIRRILRNKYKDFELCKNIDDPSLGRAYRRVKSTPESGEAVISSLLLSKITISKQMSEKEKDGKSVNCESECGRNKIKTLQLRLKPQFTAPIKSIPLANSDNESDEWD